MFRGDYRQPGRLSSVTSKRGLVLAGGGLAGIAWEIGILRGIEDEAAETARALLDSDVIVGTSAGSAVAAQLGSGLSLDELYDRQIKAYPRRSTPASTSTTSPSCSSTRYRTPTPRWRRSCSASERSHTHAHRVRGGPPRCDRPAACRAHDWPDRELRITAIDIGTGELVAFDRESGVELVDAVAASCAVPGAWPPVTIGERRYMDGGVGSTMNLKLAGDCDAVVVLVPSGKGRRRRSVPTRPSRSTPSAAARWVCSPTTNR